MTAIASSTDSGFDPSNPVDYATAMGNVASQLQNSTFQSVGNILSGLPTISQLSQGAYGFLGSTVQQENNLLTQNVQGTQDFMSQNVQQILPVISGVATAAAANQAQAIAAENSVAMATTHSGGKK